MGSTAQQIYTKTPTEVKRTAWTVPAGDFATGETISTAQIVASPTGGSHVTFGSAAIDGLVIQFLASNGVHGQLYHLTMTVTTSTGQSIPYCAYLIVENC